MDNGCSARSLGSNSSACYVFLPLARHALAVDGAQQHIEIESFQLARYALKSGRLVVCSQVGVSARVAN